MMSYISYISWGFANDIQKLKRFACQSDLIKTFFKEWIEGGHFKDKFEYDGLLTVCLFSFFF